MIFKDYYKILGLDTNKVNLTQIKNAYKEQAKKRKNGRFLNYGGYYAVGRGKMSYNCEILYLSDKMLVLQFYQDDYKLGIEISISQ